MPFSLLKTLPLVLITAFLLTACDSGSVTSQERSSVKQEQPVLMINGHRLPPEPDPEENNAILLGIDSNNNGVRDDVERWIYQTYKDKHPVHIDIAMQAGRAYTKVLVDPSKALEIHDEVSAPVDCGVYYEVYAHPPLVKERIVSELFLEKILFNTPERIKAYHAYDKLLSGQTYSLPWSDELQQKCDFDTSKYGKNDD